MRHAAARVAAALVLACSAGAQAAATTASRDADAAALRARAASLLQDLVEQPATTMPQAWGVMGKVSHSTSPLPLEERAELLRAIRALLPEGSELDGAAAYCQGQTAWRRGRLREAWDRFAEARRFGDSTVRKPALRMLLEVGIQRNDFRNTLPLLDDPELELDEIGRAVRHADLLLRAGLLREGTRELHAVAARAPDDPAVRRLLLEELLIYERYDEAKQAAAQVGPPRSDDDRKHAAMVGILADLELGNDAVATANLRALQAKEQLPFNYLARVRAMAALAALRRGSPLDEVAAALGPDATADLDQLWENSLHARARLVLARHRAGSVMPGELVALRDELARQFDWREGQWRSQPTLTAGVAFLEESMRRDLVVCLCEAEVAIDGAAAIDRCLARLLAMDGCGSMARARDLPNATPNEARALLAPGGMLVWLLPAPNGSAALVLTDDGGELVRLPPDLHLRAQVRALREAVLDQRSAAADWRAALARAIAPLGEWVFAGGLRRHIEAHHHIAIVGRELATGLPFELLPWDGPDGPDGPWLGLARAIECLPSVTLAAAQQRRGPSRPATARDQVTLLAATTLDPDVARILGNKPLPLSRADLAALAADIAPDAVLTGIDTDRAALLRALDARGCLVVFAHGALRPKGADAATRTLPPAGLALRDGFFGADALGERDGMPDVIVLATCRAARASVARGEDDQLFPTAWLAAGARAVLAAEGDLELEATELLVRAFLRECADGADPAEALRRARVAVARTAGFEHPAFHCLLRLDRAGAARLSLPLRPAGTPWLALGLGAAALAAAAAAWRLRRGPQPDQG